MMQDSPFPDQKDAVQRLVAGNQRFSVGQASHPRQNPHTRTEVAQGQRPFAAILGCSDSRVAPELVFDEGLGDLFVVRVAGHVVGRAVLASLEMAVENLGIRLIVVLGHDACAAVASAVKMFGLGAGGRVHHSWIWDPGLDATSAMPAGHVGELAGAIKPALDEAHVRGGDMLDDAINANIERTVEQLRTSLPILSQYVVRHGLRIVGARYNLLSGLVTFRA